MSGPPNAHPAVRSQAWKHPERVPESPDSVKLPDLPCVSHTMLDSPCPFPGLSISWHWGSTAPEPAFQPLIYPSSAVMGKITPARGPCYIRCPLPPPSLPLQVHSSPSAAPSTPSRHLEGRGAQGEDKQICIQSSSTK